jgi:hypothetical protein
MAKQLRKLRVVEVALVRKGAVPSARILIQKSADSPQNAGEAWARIVQLADEIRAASRTPLTEAAAIDAALRTEEGMRLYGLYVGALPTTAA